MFAGFKKFILQGNVIDLAVGVVIGAAFGALVKAFTDAFITPLIAAPSGRWPLASIARNCSAVA